MILTVTLNPAVDHTIQLTEPLTDGSIVRTNAHSFNAGGKGINVSKYLQKLAVPTTTTGLLGGLTGQFIEAELSQRRLNHEFTQIDGTTRLNTTILTSDDEYKINQYGPRVSSASIDDVVETITRVNPETVVVAGSLPPGLDVDAVDRIADAGPWQTAVDIGGEFLPTLDAAYILCTPNRAELATATGMETETVDQCRSACRTIRASGFEYVITSLGTDGAVLVGDSAEYYARALDVPVVDTVGAGDGLLAGVFAAFHDGATPEAALRHGVAVASEVVSTAGTNVSEFTDITESARNVAVTTYRRDEL